MLNTVCISQRQLSKFLCQLFEIGLFAQYKMKNIGIRGFPQVLCGRTLLAFSHGDHGMFVIALLCHEEENNEEQ
jgi:hypothetical protein